jgi:hypothetical protein
MSAELDMHTNYLSRLACVGIAGIAETLGVEIPFQLKNTNSRLQVHDGLTHDGQLKAP